MLSNLLEDTQNDFVNALGDTVEAHYVDDGRHTKRIGEMMYRFAIVNNFSYQEARMLKLAASMHDIGKISVPNDILEKPGTLNEEEFRNAQRHTVEGHHILERSSIPLMKTAAQIALYHHERFDGSGYPEQRGGLNIPLSARMMALVDVFDAVTHDRCYGLAMSREDAITVLEKGSGGQFDPKLVNLFLENLANIVDGDE